MRYFLILTSIVFVTMMIKTYSNNIEIDDKPDYILGYKIPEMSDIKKQTKGFYPGAKRTISIVQLNDTVGIIEIGAPSVVAIADKFYPWGWFQFPILGVDEKGHIIVRWSMRNDTADDYGKSNDINSYRISFDGGLSWNIPLENQLVPIYNESVNLPNGDLLALNILPAEDVSTLLEHSLPIYSEGETDFYWENTLPNKFKGIYETYFHDKTRRTIHANVNNNGLIRTVTNKRLSTFWFGKLQIKDGNIFACVYPTHYIDNNGKPSPITVTCYKSADLGKTWNIQGKIDYTGEVNFNNHIGLNKKGFTEPTFVFLNDNKMLCVMRTSAGKVSPMYKSYSSDYGVSWSTPEPFTPNGVMPQLIKLDDDILVMASGRPGIQLRFSFDGNGNYWTDPIELVDYDENENWVYNSCGYPFLYRASDNEVYIVYSDFRNKNISLEDRKSIIFRRIKVYRQRKS